MAGLFALPSSSIAGLSTSPGTSAAAFLDLGFGARAVAVAEAFVSAADDVTAAHYNPAGFAYPAFSVDPSQKSRPYEVLVGQSLLVQEISMTQFALARRPFAFSLTRLSLDGIEARTAETASPDGRLNAADLALGVSAAHQFAGIGVGATVKFLHENIGPNTASALAVDLGLLRRFEGSPLSVGACLANVGSKMRYVDQAAPLPTVFRSGITYGLTTSFPHMVTLEVDVPRDDGPIVRLGVEYAGFGPLALRFGYQSHSSTQRAAALGKALGTTTSGLSEFYGMTMGAGLRTAYGTFDYAIIPYGELGTAQRFAYSYAFGGKR